MTYGGYIDKVGVENHVARFCAEVDEIVQKKREGFLQYAKIAEAKAK